MFISFEREGGRERERQKVCVPACEHAHVRGGGAERERIPSRLHNVSAEPDTRLELRNIKIMT